MLTAENNYAYGSGKTYDHNMGLSCSFRQWGADSHCKFMHGYSFNVGFRFSATTLDKNNWVVDFGALKTLKLALENMLDHKTLVAHDDPQMAWFEQGHDLGVLDLVVVNATGCECLARQVFETTLLWMQGRGYYPRVSLDRVTVREHSGNSGWYGIAK